MDNRLGPTSTRKRGKDQQPFRACLMTREHGAAKGHLCKLSTLGAVSLVIRMRAQLSAANNRPPLALSGDGTQTSRSDAKSSDARSLFRFELLCRLPLVQPKTLCPLRCVRSPRLKKGACVAGQAIPRFTNKKRRRTRSPKIYASPSRVADGIKRSALAKSGRSALQRPISVLPLTR